MKKLAIVAAMAMAIASFTACGNQTKKGGLKTDVDSLSYAIGMEQSQGIQQYLQQLVLIQLTLTSLSKVLRLEPTLTTTRRRLLTMLVLPQVCRCL